MSPPWPPYPRHMLDRRELLLSGLLGLAALPGCTARPFSGTDPRGPLAPLSDPKGRYGDYTTTPEVVLDRSVHVRTHYDRREIRLAPRIPLDLVHVPGAADPIRLQAYFTRRSPGTRVPTVVLLPILGNTALMVDVFAARLAEQGMHACIVLRREESLEPKEDVASLEAEARVSLIRARQAVTWLAARPDVDPARLGTLGISAGAIQGVMLAGTDVRLQTHAWLLGGGPLADVVMESREGRIEEGREVLKAALDASDRRLHRLLQTGLRSDPLKLARHVDPAGVLMVLARRDRSVPHERGRDLWRALGRPRLEETPLGHYTTFALLPWLLDVTTEHFRQRFGLRRRLGGGGAPSIR